MDALCTIPRQLVAGGEAAMLSVYPLLHLRLLALMTGTRLFHYAKKEHIALICPMLHASYATVHFLKCSALKSRRFRTNKSLHV